MSSLKLGKLPARNAVSFKFAKYSALAPAPSKAGHYSLVTDWQGMMGNDQYGDCVCAEAGHATIYFNQESGKLVKISTKNVLSMYSAVTGFSPKDPNSDQGTDMQQAASYRRKTGILDSSGKRHKIVAYIALAVGDKNQMKQAVYYFGGFGLGFQFPASAMTQFNAGKNWTVVSKSPIEGGHDVWVCGYDSQYVYLNTWGDLIKATWGFVLKYMDEGLVYLTAEMLTNNKSLEGFDLTALQVDLKKL